MWPRLELSDATLQIRLVSRDYTRYTQFSNTYWGMNIAAESDIFEARKGRDYGLLPQGLVILLHVNKHIAELFDFE